MSGEMKTTAATADLIQDLTGFDNGSPPIPTFRPVIAMDFVSALAKLNVFLPLEMRDDDIGVVIDVQGHDVFTVDVNGARPDDEVIAICRLIVLACNTCGGLRAALSGAEGERP